MNGKWYAGVPHLHTVASDGRLNIEQLVSLAKKNKLDFLIVTDHNKNCEKDLPTVDGLTLIYGTELTSSNGHTNIWGVKDSVDDFAVESYEQWKEAKDEAKRRGALVCMNHPLCGQCPWRWEKDISQVDVLEVWNSPMHYDNLLCTEWWHEQMKKGHKTPVVGGSDYHRDYYVTNLLTNPTTYVYAQSASPRDILAAIAAGRTTITSGVGKTFITITSGDAMLGDTVKLDEATTVTVDVKGLKRGHRLAVFDANGEYFSHTARKNEDFNVTLPVRGAGFVCAQVEYEVGRIYKIGYNKVIASKIPSQRNMDLPPFIYAQSGAMFFE